MIDRLSFQYNNQKIKYYNFSCSITLRCKAIRAHILGVGASWLVWVGCGCWVHPTQPKTYLRAHISWKKQRAMRRMVSCNIEVE